MMQSLFALFLLAAPAAFAGKAEWKIVPNAEVCMVTNTHFKKPQIPVAQSGKTYYGCCENCKATIENDPTSRAATDPVTNKSVDKASATIAANEDGEVLYFENKKNFERYVAGETGNARSTKKR